MNTDAKETRRAGQVRQADQPAVNPRPKREMLSMNATAMDHGTGVWNGERLSYQQAKANLKSIAKGSFVGQWDAIDIGCYVSKCLIIDIPADDLFRRFVTQYTHGLHLLVSDGNIQPKENYLQMCVSDPHVYFPDGVREQVHVGIVSDNITFFLTNGSVSFRSFGQGDVELSRMFINRSHRGKGTGTALVEIAKETARLVGCRLLLFPAAPYAECENWDAARCVAESKRLRKWYSKLGFVNALPEMKEAIRLGGDRKMLVGICDLMAFR